MRQVREFEAFIGRTLPKQLRVLYTTVNGGCPRRRVVGGTDRLITSYLGIYGGRFVGKVSRGLDVYSVIQWLGERILVDDSFALPLVPFAELFGGDYLCLDYRASGVLPTVVVWLHELSHDLAPETYPVGNAFTDFLSRCVPAEG